MEKLTVSPESRKPLDLSKPGFSAKFLEILNEHPDIQAADIRLLIPKIIHRPDAVGRVLENSGEYTENEGAIIESKAIEGFLIPELWEAELVRLNKFMDDPSMAKSTPFDFLERDRLSRITSDPISKSLLVERKIQIMENEEASLWEKKYEGLLAAKSKDPRARAYARLGQLLDKRIQAIHGRDAQANIGQRMQGVLGQARQIVWTLFRTAYIKSKEKYPENINPEEFRAKIEATLNSTRTLTFALASCHPAVAQSVIGYINSDLISKDQNILHFGNAKGYQSDCFILVEHLGINYLELNPEIFRDLLEVISTQTSREVLQSITTKCPAILVTDNSNRNIVSSYFDKNKELFVKHCL